MKMNINILEIVSAKITEIEKDGTLETLISKTVEDSVSKVIKDTFSGYEFKKELEKKLKTEVDNVLGQVSLKSYNQVMIDRMKSIINAVQGESLADEVEKHFKDIFIGSQPFKMSDIFEAIRESFKGDSCDKYEEYYTLIVENERDGFIYYYFDEESDKRKYDCDYRIGIHYNRNDKELKGDIFSLQLEGTDFSKGIMSISQLFDWEKKLLNAFLQKTKIEADITDADDVNTSLWDEY